MSDLNLPPEEADEQPTEPPTDLDEETEGTEEDPAPDFVPPPPD